MNVAVIPARGGSKRIPGKNIRPFAGKPMLAHSVLCAKASGLFGRIVVSTEDDAIAAVALSVGAEVPFLRPPHLADDHTGITDVMAHAVQGLMKPGTRIDAVCCVSATAPFIRVADLREGLSLLLADDWRYVFSAAAFSHPIFRSFERTASGGVRMFFPEYRTTRSQDLPAALHDAGQFYWGRPDAWIARAPIFDERSAAVLIPSWRAQDIDTPDDWQRAEYMELVIKEMEKHADLL